MRNSVKSTLDLQPLQKENISFDTHVEIKVSTIWLPKIWDQCQYLSTCVPTPTPTPTPPLTQNYLPLSKPKINP